MNSISKTINSDISGLTKIAKFQTLQISAAGQLAINIGFSYQSADGTQLTAIDAEKQGFAIGGTVVDVTNNPNLTAEAKATIQQLTDVYNAVMDALQPVIDSVIDNNTTPVTA